MRLKRRFIHHILGKFPGQSEIRLSQCSSAKLLSQLNRDSPDGSSQSRTIVAQSPTGRVCAAQVEVRPHSAKWSGGRGSHRPISPVKSGPRPIVPAQGRIRVRMPVMLPLSAIGRSHPENPHSASGRNLKHPIRPLRS